MIADYLIDLAADGFILEIKRSRFVPGIQVSITHEDCKEYRYTTTITSLDLTGTNDQYKLYREIEKMKKTLLDTIEKTEK